MDALRGRTLALVVTGSIAAYKAVEVARLLLKAGATVLPIMTRSAERFVGAVTLSGISGQAVALDMWDPAFSGEMHVALSDRADAVVVVPATADFLARLAAGRADDLASALILCAKGPVLVAPAMHPRMWSHPATVANAGALARMGRVEFVGPVDGEVASGDRGTGRMAEPVDIVAAVAAALGRPRHTEVARDLVGRHVVVSAGPTVEDLDPVRFLGNRSTGKMGFAIAARAAARGARTTLVSGPVSLETPAGVDRIDVRSALEMERALADLLSGETASANADALIMAAAVADYRPREIAAHKIKKSGDVVSLEMVKNPDLLREIGVRRGQAAMPILVGFAVETGTESEVVAYARGKLAAKKVDLVVANAASDSFGRDDNTAILVTATEEIRLGTLDKRVLADRILDAVVARLAPRT